MVFNHRRSCGKNPQNEFSFSYNAAPAGDRTFEVLNITTS